jgi:hypothetical protein
MDRMRLWAPDIEATLGAVVDAAERLLVEDHIELRGGSDGDPD